ncbi:hypothetical protein B0A55_05204 [Friedmanniomyces simplex]|uniref:Uncharacterized protein n=1 Tax=Friedmanniomyces simplex TaxID=329884 RepID=A0A4U0XAZ3_9PEZI|nr:hypothetical protein B0A55_05204 [Friedmanniomyces simplex]
MVSFWKSAFLVNGGGYADYKRQAFVRRRDKKNKRSGVRRDIGAAGMYQASMGSASSLPDSGSQPGGGMRFGAGGGMQFGIRGGGPAGMQSPGGGAGGMSFGGPAGMQSPGGMGGASGGPQPNGNMPFGPMGGFGGPQSVGGHGMPSPGGGPGMYGGMGGLGGKGKPFGGGGPGMGSATSQQANVPMSKVTQVAENIRNGKADDKVNEHFEKVRLGTVRSVQQQLPQPAQQPAVTAPAPQYGGYASSSSQAYKQSAASPPPPQQYGYASSSSQAYKQDVASPPAPQQYRYASSSSQAYKQSVASPPAPQQAYPPAPTYSAPTSMYGGHQYATTHTTTMTSTSSSSTQQAQQGYGVQSPGASYGYAQPLQQQLPAAGQPPLQLTEAPYDPNTIANFNQQGGGEQYDYPGSPQPVVAYAGGQEYGTSPQEYEQPLESPEYGGYDQYEQDAAAPEQPVASTKAKKKKTSSKTTKK